MAILIVGNQMVSKLFRAYRLYNLKSGKVFEFPMDVSKLFRAYGLYNKEDVNKEILECMFQSSFELTGYITA